MLGLIQRFMGGGVLLPRDQRTRIPRRVKKQAAVHADAMQKAVDEIAALPGLADMAQTRQAPRGFYGLVDSLLEHYDAYLEIVSKALGVEGAVRPGTAEGKGACYAGPFPVSGVEALHIYREIRPWRTFPQLGQDLAEQAQTLIDGITARNKGKDPSKMRLTGKSVAQGRLDYSKDGHLCPFFDEAKDKCSLGPKKPIACRMHFITTDAAWSDPKHARHKDVKAKNLRLPIRTQVQLSQMDRRLNLQLTPFLYASVLQLVQATEGELLQEVGEPPIKMGQDGRVARRANRSKKGSKKAKKGKKGKKGKGKK